MFSSFGFGYCNDVCKYTIICHVLLVMTTEMLHKHANMLLSMEFVIGYYLWFPQLIFWLHFLSIDESLFPKAGIQFIKHGTEHSNIKEVSPLVKDALLIKYWLGGFKK